MTQCPLFEVCKRYFGNEPMPKKCFKLETALLCGVISRGRYLRKKRIETMKMVGEAQPK
jgi:hypothetical protein